ncbi:MAG TPA: peptide chain release factor N(5)-glutamine methyltransferase [Candidatus Polarisedimenticolia bacterium]|nr:peptide chain release factor N(5)-glutamine methyltransferase [Candidatus Polarisedimenticolia bacterium]
MIAEGRATLEAAGVPEARRDAEVLLAHVLSIDSARLLAHPETSVEPEAAARYRDLLRRRAGREPLQHLTGVQEFWSLAFRVSPATLIPRPETEGILEAFFRLNRGPAPAIVDVGTGSGCLAVVVAREVPGARVLACDLSEGALRVARDNAATHGVAGRIEFRRGDLFGPLRGDLEGGIDFILSNPPYVREDELEGLMPEVRDHEPLAALVAGPDGLAVHRRLAGEAADFLKPGGHLIVECGSGQDVPLRGLYRDHPGLELVAIQPDLAGIPRILIVRAR